MVEELDIANSIHAFNRFEEEGFVERFQCHFRLVDIPRDAFYALAMPATRSNPRQARGRYFQKALLNFYDL